MPDPIRDLAATLDQTGHAVWIIGSRVNDNSKPESDWDLLVFGDEELIEKLRGTHPVAGCDLMVVHNDDAFIKPWEVGDAGGNLGKWEWQQLNSEEATYKGTKWPDDWGSPKKAIRFRS